MRRGNSMSFDSKRCSKCNSWMTVIHSVDATVLLSWDSDGGCWRMRSREDLRSMLDYNGRHARYRCTQCGCEETIREANPGKDGAGLLADLELLAEAQIPGHGEDWMGRRHKALGGKTPAQAVAAGQADHVRGLLARIARGGDRNGGEPLICDVCGLPPDDEHMANEWGCWTCGIECCPKCAHYHVCAEEKHEARDIEIAREQANES